VSGLCYCRSCWGFRVLGVVLLVPWSNVFGATLVFWSDAIALGVMLVPWSNGSDVLQPRALLSS
jgi:hypothetical protein